MKKIKEFYIKKGLFNGMENINVSNEGQYKYLINKSELVEKREYI